MKNSNTSILFLVLAFAFWATGMQAQEMGQDFGKEVGIRLSGLSNFGIIYKKKKKENKFRRYRAGFARIGFSSNEDQQSFNLRTNLAVGTEKRRAINQRFHFIHGTEFVSSIDISTVEDRASALISPGIGFVLGFQYALAAALNISLEIIPSITAEVAIDNEGFRDRIAVNAGFNSQAAALNLVYRFNDRSM